MNKRKGLTSPAVFPDFRSNIAETIRGGLAPGKLLDALGTYHEKDIALTLPLLSRAEQQRTFHILPPDKLASVLEYAEDASSYFSLLGIRQKLDVLSAMEVPAAAALLQQLDQEERYSLLELIGSDARTEIQLIRSFEEEAIGSRMSTNFIEISSGSTVKEAMSQLICQAADHTNISTLYLTDNSGIFCGAIDLKDLIIAREDTPLSSITTFCYPYLYAKTAVDDCIAFFTEYSEEAIPVLDEKNRLIGVVTAQDFMEMLDDELGDDYAKLGGLTAQEDLSEPVMQSVRKRMPWLCILLFMGLGVSATVGLFESIVAKLPVIMCFQSLILDMAGNVGTQSLAVAIRILMDPQVLRGDKINLIWKEAKIGLVNGALLGFLSFAAIGGYLSLTGNASAFAFAVSGCLGIAMVLAMLVSSLSGTLIPIFFHRLGIDPAVASGPLITTVNDLVAVVTYYGLSWLILLKLLGLG